MFLILSRPFFFILIGTKFLLVADPQQPSIDHTMKKIYETYADYCIKNPFQNPEMPIRSEQFDVQLLKLVKTVGGLVPASNPYIVNSHYSSANFNSGTAASQPMTQSNSLPPTLPNIASAGLGLGV